MKKVQIDIARTGNVTHAHVLILSSDSGVRCAHGIARRHPADDDVPFIGALQAVTRAITDGVAAHRMTENEAKQIVMAVCKRPDVVSRPTRSAYDEIMIAARAAGLR